MYPFFFCMCASFLSAFFSIFFPLDHWSAKNEEMNYPNPSIFIKIIRQWSCNLRMEGSFWGINTDAYYKTIHTSSSFDYFLTFLLFRYEML